MNFNDKQLFIHAIKKAIQKAKPIWSDIEKREKLIEKLQWKYYKEYKGI